jgi:hypothetical protein
MPFPRCGCAMPRPERPERRRQQTILVGECPNPMSKTAGRFVFKAL